MYGIRVIYDNNPQPQPQPLCGLPKTQASTHRE